MPHIDLGDIKYYCELHGEGAQTITILNGLTMSTAAWAAALKDFTPHFRVLLLDMRGQGQTERTDEACYPLPRQADDLARLLDTIDTYYELVDQRIPGHGEPLEELHKRKILIDGKKDALLLQIFSENQLGPIFFEFIQRKGDDGFGNGNFKALFESIELDQIRRGVLKAPA